MTSATEGLWVKIKKNNRRIGIYYGYGVLCHFQQYFSYIVAVNFIGKGMFVVSFFFSFGIHSTKTIKKQKQIQ